MRLIRGSKWGLWALFLLLAVSHAASGQTGNFCVRDFQSGAVCTANDVRIEELIPVSILEACGEGTIGETEVIFELLVSADGSPDRYDIGLYLALDGGSARDGDSCFHDYLEPPLTATPTLGDKNMDGVPDVDNGPWLENDGDQCGDIGTNTQVFKTLTALRFACVDNNLDGSVDVSVCTSWDNNANTTCSTVADAFPGTNSKCSCDSVELGISPLVPGLAVSKTPATQSVLTGTTANFTITVENTGNVDLSDPMVSDPQCDSLTGPSGDTDNDGVLDVAETWTYTCSVNNVTADFTNSVTVTATPPTGPDVSDSDTADVTVEDPSLVVSKTPDNQTVLTGGTAAFTITVENTGNVDLSNPMLDDPQCTTLTGPTGDDGDGVLEVGETWSYTCEVENVTAGFINTATATATPPTGPDVSDSDTATVDVDAPSISVSKTPATQSVLIGTAATFTITVDNTGNVDLSSVVVDDPQCTTLTGPSGDDGDDVLETTETWTYTCEVENVTADFTNSVTVTGTPPTGPDVSDSDTADVTAEDPSLAVSKTPATQSVLVGTAAVFTITVDNTGNVDLSAVMVDDAFCDSLVGPSGDTDGDSVLDVTETWTYTCTVNNVTADFTNSVTVTATPPTGPDVSDGDTADVTVEDPSLSVSKTPDTQAVLINGTAMFTITVENTGNVDLTNPVVDDPQCTTLTGPTGDDGDGVLEVGETWTYTCEVTNVTSGFINTASATATPPTGPDVSDEDSATVTVDAPSISVNKSPANQTVLVGSPASFTLTVENTGNVDLVNVTVVDLPCDTLTGPSGDDGDNVLELGETWTYDCTVDEVFEAFTNSVTVTANPVESEQEVSDSDTADVAVVSPTVTATKSSSLSADLDDSGTLTAGDRILYTVEIENTGTGDALDVLFTDLPDPNTSLVVGTVMTSQGTILRGNTAGDFDVVVELGTLAPGASATVSFEVELDDPLAEGVDQVVNQGLVSGSNFPDVPTDDPRTVPSPDPTVDGIDQPEEVFEIPTLSEWGFLLFVLVLATAAMVAMRRRRTRV